MKLSQFVIRVAMHGDFRGHDYSMLTDDHLDVYQKVVELGYGHDTGQTVAEWAQKAKWGDIWGPRIIEGTSGMELTVKCHAPYRGKVVLKKKRGKPRKKE